MRQSRESGPHKETDRGWVKSESLTFSLPNNNKHSLFSVGIDPYLPLSLHIHAKCSYLLQEAIALQSTIHSPLCLTLIMHILPLFPSSVPYLFFCLTGKERQILTNALRKRCFLCPVFSSPLSARSSAFSDTTFWQCYVQTGNTRDTEKHTFTPQLLQPHSPRSWLQVLSTDSPPSGWTEGRCISTSAGGPQSHLFPLFSRHFFPPHHPLVP